MVRQPVVAGTFYSKNPSALSLEIDTYLNNAKLNNFTKTPFAVIAPHAGYTYSGQCAAYSYNAIKNNNFKLAVIIAPSHKYNNFEFSIGNFSAYNTPLGEIKVDKTIANNFLNLPNFEFNREAHMFEHSIEVQLPFIQKINPNCKILPILVSYSADSSYLANALFLQFKDKLDETVFIISSDLSHYHCDEKAQKMDLLFAEKLKQFNATELNNLFLQKKIEACGFNGIVSIVKFAKKLNAKAHKLCYTHSGKVSSDSSSVVGYLSMAFCK